MYQIDKTTNSITALSVKGFGALGFSERAHLQEWIAKCPECLGEELLILAKEFDGFDETRERLDLLALDKQGGLVLIENKLDDSGRDVVWQALKYASYCSSLSKSQIVAIFQSHLVKNGGGDAREKIEEFLDKEDYENLILNSGIDQRVILVAAHFRKEVTSTVLWLLQHGIRLQCIRATAFDNGGQIFLNMEQIIPTPEAEDFMIKVVEKEKEQQTTERTQLKRVKLRLAFWEQTLAALEAAGVTRYSNVNPSDDHWLDAGSGLSGVPFTMIFSQKEARADLSISRGSREENKWLFDRLYEQKDAIEADFGAPMEWLRLDNRKAAGIRYRKEFDGYDPENWPEMIEWLTQHVKRLEKAFGGRLKPLGQKLRAEFNSTGAFQEEVEG
jgi:Domain of unknown function (DUF4268)